MKHNKKKFSSTDKLLPFLQLLQQEYAPQCYIFSVFTKVSYDRLNVYVIIGIYGRKVVDWGFYWHNDPETLESKYKELCDYLKQV